MSLLGALTDPFNVGGVGGGAPVKRSLTAYDH
jgi:hypothetical protein